MQSPTPWKAFPRENIAAECADMFLVNGLRTCCIRTKKVLVLIPAARGSGRSANKHQDNQREQSGAGKLSGLDRWKAGCSGGDALEKAPNQEISSVAFNKSVPATINMTVVVMMILECSMSFLKGQLF